MRQLIFTFLICTTVSGCAFAGAKVPIDDKLSTIVAIRQSTTCGNITTSQWLDNEKQYHSVFQAMFQDLISDPKPRPASIDFESHGALLISMGQQRTGGYAVKLVSRQMRISNGRAEISVNWRIAKSGMVTIQMLTNPCLLLKVPRGSYRVIDIVDQSGKVQQTISVK